MEQGGNRVVNRIFEASLIANPATKLSATSEMSVRNAFCQKKYVDRKYYQPAEYLEALKAIKRAAANAHVKSGKACTMRVIKPEFQRTSSQIMVTKEAISDDDFFKSMNDDDDWEDPFEVSKKRPIRPKRNGSKDELSRSWHPESPTKAPRQRQSGVESTKTMDRRNNPVLAPKRGTSLFVKKAPLNFLDEDSTILDSICKTDSVGTSATATNTSRRNQGKRTDMLSTTCHGSLSTNNRTRNRELSNSRHKKATHEENHEFARRSEPKLDAYNDPIAAQKPRSSTASSRPRLSRRQSLSNIASEIEMPRVSKTDTSNLVVEALIDFIQATTEVTEEEVNMIMKCTNRQDSNAKHKPRDTLSSRREKQLGGHSRGDEAPPDAPKSGRTGRMQRGGQGGRSTSRSSSRSRANSRARRVALPKRNAGDNLGASNRKRSSSPTRGGSKARSRPSRQGSQENSQHPSVGPIHETNGAEKSTPLGTSRRGDPPTRSQSGCGLSRSRRNDSQHRPQDREDPARSHSRGSGRPKRSDGGHDPNSGKSNSLSGRNRRGGSHHGPVGSNEGTMTKRKLKSDKGTISGSCRSSSEHDKVGPERKDSYNSYSDDPTASEASDILDDEDMMIM